MFRKGVITALFPGIFSLFLISGCVSVPEPVQSEDPPIRIGICHPGEVWEKSSYLFSEPPGSYERREWAGRIRGYYKPEVLDSLGVHWFRSSLSWKDVEPAPGEWDYQGVEEFLAAAEEQNKKVLALLTYDTPWLYKEEERTRHIRPEEVSFYLEYVKNLALRYRDSIDGFEIWNEPNFRRFWKGTDQEFFYLTRETVKILKETAPEIPVAVGALSYHPVTRGRAFLKGMIEYGAVDLADAISLHPYGASIDASARRVRKAEELLLSYGLKKEIWITEMGYPTTGLYFHRVNLEDHGEITAKSLVMMAASGADLITWYHTFDKYTPDEKPVYTPSEASFGLLYPDYSPKPGGYAFQVLGNRLHGSRYVPEALEYKGIRTGGIRAYAFLKENELTLILWSTRRGSFQPLQIDGFREATGTVITGDSPAYEHYQGDIQLMIGKNPVLITGTAGTSLPAILLH